MNGTHNTTAMSLTCKAYFEKKSKIFELAGQKARMLAALIKAGKDGVTALELSNTWAYRTSAYVHDLRNAPYNFDIEMIREEHAGGWHGRYILHTPCEILEGGE